MERPQNSLPRRRPCRGFRRVAPLWLEFGATAAVVTTANTVVLEFGGCETSANAVLEFGECETTASIVLLDPKH